jgi:hypothetical protein
MFQGLLETTTFRVIQQVTFNGFALAMPVLFSSQGYTVLNSGETRDRTKEFPDCVPTQCGLYTGGREAYGVRDAFGVYIMREERRLYADIKRCVESVECVSAVRNG